MYMTLWTFTHFVFCLRGLNGRCAGGDVTEEQKLYCVFDRRGLLLEYRGALRSGKVEHPRTTADMKRSGAERPWRGVRDCLYDRDSSVVGTLDL